MVKRSDAIFAVNMPRRKNRRIGAIVSGVGLVLFLVVVLLVLPREISALPQRALGLLFAAWVWLTWRLATHEEETPEELLYRLRRAHNSDFGKQLLLNQAKQGTFKLPVIGEVTPKNLAGPTLFLVVCAWWLSPLAPVRVGAPQIEDMTVLLGEQIIAGSLVMPDGHTALAAPPVVPQRARTFAKLIRDGDGAYALGMKAVVERRFDDARKLLETASQEGKGDAMRVALGRGQNEIYAGEFEAAIPFLEAALAKSSDDPALLCQLAMAWIYQGQFAKAEPLASQAAKLGGKGAAAAGAIHVQSLLAVALGKDYEVAQAMCRQARERLTEDGKAERLSPIMPASLNNQAVLYALCGKYYGAEELFKNAQDDAARLSGKKHPDMGLVLANLATLDACLARYDAAKNRFHQALAIDKEDGPPEPLRRAAVLCGLATVHAALAEFDSGRKLTDEARALAENELGVEHPLLAVIHELLGDLSAGEGHENRADGHFLRALVCARKVWGAAHPFVAAILNHRALICVDQGRYQDVGPLVKQVLEICDQAKAGDRAETAAALYHRALAAVRQNQVRGIRADLDKALAIQRDIYGKKNPEGVREGDAEHPDIARTLGCLASLSNTPMTYAGGVTQFAQAIAMAEKFLGAGHPAVAELLISEANLHAQRGKIAEAETCLKQALEIERKRLPTTHPMIAATLDRIAAVCDKLDPPQYERAQELRAEAKELREEHAEVDRSE